MTLLQGAIKLVDAMPEECVDVRDELFAALDKAAKAGGLLRTSTPPTLDLLPLRTSV